jgi:hypothetical protein
VQQLNHPTPSIESILSDPSTSKWLASSLTSALERDPVDAANDAAMLEILLSKRANDVLINSIQNSSCKP